MEWTAFGVGLYVGSFAGALVMGLARMVLGPAAVPETAKSSFFKN